MFRILNSVNSKALLIVSFIFLLSFILIITSFLFKGAMKETYTLIDHANKVENSIQGILFRMKDSEADMRAYIITHQQLYYNDFSKNNIYILDKVKELRGFVKDPEQLVNSVELEQYVQERFVLLERMALFVDSIKISEFQEIIKEGEAISRKIEEHLSKMVDHEKTILAQYESELFSLMDLRQKLSIFGSLLAMILGVVTFKLIKKESNSIQKRQELLQELNDNKDKFFSIISHDLKNPFSAIKAFIEMLNDSDYHEDKETIYKMLQSSSDRFDNLLSNLLTWARLQMDAINVNKERIDLSKMIRQVSEHYTALIESKNLTLEINTKKDIHACADKAMTETVLRNLISNAIKFTDNGRILLSVYAKSNKVVIEVSDTGIGMEESVLQNLFQLGKVNSTKGTHNETGTGMGLILCKDMAERQGGSLEVSSVIGKGTTVKLYLESDDNR